MLRVEITEADGQQRVVDVPAECVIGKSGECEVRLNSWRVSKQHARLYVTSAGILVEDLGSYGGITVNGERVDGHYGPVKPADVLVIASFKLRVSLLSAQEEAAVPVVQVEKEDDLLPPHAAQAAQAPVTPARRTDNAAPREEPVTRQAVPDRASAPAPAAAPPAHLAVVPLPSQRYRDLEFDWRQRIHLRLLETIDLRRRDVSSMSDAELRAETSGLIRMIMRELGKDIPRELDHDLLAKQVLDEAVGLGPLEELLDDDSVSEIMVNRFDEIFVERGGRLTRHPLTFTGDRAVMGVIERIVAPLGRRIDESSPMVDARLKDGSRVNAIIPPLALKGATLTIRKFAKRKLEAADLVKFGAISPDMAAFLQVCVESRRNVVVSGGTGSGKTTLLNILSNFIPDGERIITVEDAAELKLNHQHLISLESRPANVEGKGAVPIRDLVKNTLRMRPDRIVVGECRGAEALDMLQAMNTGHEGSLTTLHANTPRDAIARLETMVLMAGMDLPLVAIREQIASAVNLVVQQTRFSCGSRKITSITELTGMESGKMQMQELFKFVSKGYAPDANGIMRVQGYFTGCDMVPSFYEELRATGVELDLDIFKPHDDEPNQEWGRAGGFNSGAA